MVVGNHASAGHTRVDTTGALNAASKTAPAHGLRPLGELSAAERLNFLLTNRIPRQAATRFMGWFSRIENRLLAKASIGLWQCFVDDLRLFEAEQTRFASLQQCFTRRLRPGARPVDPRPEVFTSPCDAIIGAHGELDGLAALQAKGFPYGIDELLGDPEAAERHRGGFYLTLRLKSSMYHRFHAPTDGRVGRIRYLSGDTWNVNPVALKVVERLFCRNERVVFPFQPADDGPPLTLVAVAAVLVASVGIHGLEHPLDLDWGGPTLIDLDRDYTRGEEMGWFQHGSTLVVLAPRGATLCEGWRQGDTVRMGQALLQRP